jgi:hypothetical protein
MLEGAWVFIELHMLVFKQPTMVIENNLRSFSICGFEVVYVVEGRSSRLMDFSRENILDMLCSDSCLYPGVFWQKVREVNPPVLTNRRSESTLAVVTRPRP